MQAFIKESLVGLSFMEYSLSTVVDERPDRTLRELNDDPKWSLNARRSFLKGAKLAKLSSASQVGWLLIPYLKFLFAL